jgi:hypothetical protein
VEAALFAVFVILQDDAPPALCSACAAHVLEAARRWTPLMLSEAVAKDDAAQFVTSAVNTLRAAAPGLLQDGAPLLSSALEYCQGG